MVTVLLFAGVLLARSYGHLAGLEPGFEPGGVLTAQFSLDDARDEESEAVTLLLEETVDVQEGLPGVSCAAVALSLP